MEITSIVSFYKLFIPVLPIVKKIFFFESFFSLSNEKKAEAITYLSDCVDEREPLRKYNQEIKLSGYKMSRNYLLNTFSIKYYLFDRKRNLKFSKAIFTLKDFYYYDDYKITIRNKMIFFPILMLVMGLISGFFTWLSWEYTNPGHLKWLFVGGNALVGFQYITYSLYVIYNYIHLKRHAKRFNVFICYCRIKKMLME